MKTAISIPDHIFELAEELARKLEISRSELFARAIEEYVKDRMDHSITERLNEIYSTEDSSIDVNMAKMQSASISGDERGDCF